MLDRKGLYAYLGITFVVTYAIEGVMALSGVRFDKIPPILAQLAVAAVMWVPAMAALITMKFITREGFGIANIRFGSWKPYLATALLVPAAFFLIYGLTWLLNLGQPDWQLEDLMGLMASTGADMSQAPDPSLLLAGMLPLTLFFSPFINSLFGFGEELGWRGYLLPKLMPLGKPRAYLLLGVIWGLWHLPLLLVGFLVPDKPLWAVIAMIGLTTTLGVYINELTLHYRSSILAGWVHGVFNSQSYGIWRILFPSVNPYLGGMVGLLGWIAWLVLGLGAARYLSARQAGEK